MSTPLISCQRAAFAVPGDLATLTGGYRYDRRLMEELRALGRDITHVALASSFPQPSPADMWDAARRLAAIPVHCPVIIDGLAMGAMDYSALAGVSAPIVALVHHPLAHESGLDPQLRAALWRSERDNLALAAHVIVTSAHTAALLHSHYQVAPERITIARPGIDPPGALGTPMEPPLILSVGIQVPRKGHDVLLRALARVTQYAWQAIIVGAPRDVAHAEHLAQLLGRLGLSERVRMVGEVTPDALARLYSQATLFALATRYEGYGIVFDEAMIHGLPIVSCATGAVPSTVATGAGHLVPPDDPEAFAAALALLLNDAEARSAMAAAATAAGAALPGWDSAARRVAEVLDRVVADD